MSVERRQVEIAAGHRINCQRVRAPAARAGFVKVRTSSHRPPIEIPAARWDAGKVLTQ